MKIEFPELDGTDSAMFNIAEQDVFSYYLLSLNIYRNDRLLYSHDSDFSSRILPLFIVNFIAFYIRIAFELVFSDIRQRTMCLRVMLPFECYIKEKNQTDSCISASIKINDIECLFVSDTTITQYLCDIIILIDLLHTDNSFVLYKCEEK